MRGNNIVREEKVAPCLVEKKRTIHVKTNIGWVCLPCAKKEIKKNEKSLHS